MIDDAELRPKSDGELKAMLNECMSYGEVLLSSASEKFKQSESAGWDEGLYRQATEQLSEVERLSEEVNLIIRELQRRYEHTDLDEHSQSPVVNHGTSTSGGTERI